MEMDEPLAQVVAGTWDVEQARAQAASAKELEVQVAELTGRLQTASQKCDFAAALGIVDELIALDESHVADYAPLRFDVLPCGEDLDAAYA